MHESAHDRRHGSKINTVPEHASESSNVDHELGSSPFSNAMSMLGVQESIVQVSNKKFYEQYEGGRKSIDGTKIYFLGIIDIFTEYTAKKKAEHFFKSIKHDNKTISCIPPPEYPASEQQ